MVASLAALLLLELSQDRLFCIAFIVANYAFSAGHCGILDRYPGSLLFCSLVRPVSWLADPPPLGVDCSSTSGRNGQENGGSLTPVGLSLSQTQKSFSLCLLCAVSQR